MMQTYDLIIIGGGISGLSGAMYASRLGLKTLCLAEMPGGLITTTHLVENWPGIVNISGPDLAMALYNHAQANNVEIKNEKVLKIENLSNTHTAKRSALASKKSDRREDTLEPNSTSFKVVTTSNEYSSKTLLISTGTKYRKLDIPGVKELANKGVSYCALCDGAFFKNKIVCVVGGGDSAAKEALFLSEHASKVYIFVRKEVLRAEPINAERVKNDPKIEVVFLTELESISGEKKVEKIKIKTGRGKYSGQELPMDGVFMAIGHDAQTELASQIGVELNDKKEIKINRHSETNIPGVFAAGDCCDTEFKQAITGSSEAVTAAYYAFHVCKNGAVGF